MEGWRLTAICPHGRSNIVVYDTLTGRLLLPAVCCLNLPLKMTWRIRRRMKKDLKEI